MRGIYKITNNYDGKCYIGKSENIEKRFKYHQNSLKKGCNKNRHMQNAYDSAPQNSFQMEIIEKLYPEDDIDERERFWIKYYRANKREYGYNKTDGGDGGNTYKKYLSKERVMEISRKNSIRMKERNPTANKRCFTNGEIIRYISNEDVEKYLSMGWLPGIPDHVREKEREANLGENNGFFGRRHTTETKGKISSSRKGENNWNYGKVLMHKGDKQKYIAHDSINVFLQGGWEYGLPTYVKEKISKKNTGRKMGINTKHSKRYVYNGNIYYGWRRLRNYLRENGYPTISETAIVKLAEGKHVRGYDDLFRRIVIINS